jgi:hypothetical protein
MFGSVDGVVVVGVVVVVVVVVTTVVVVSVVDVVPVVVVFVLHGRCEHGGFATPTAANRAATNPASRTSANGAAKCLMLPPS